MVDTICITEITDSNSWERWWRFSMHSFQLPATKNSMIYLNKRYHDGLFGIKYGNLNLSA